MRELNSQELAEVSGGFFNGSFWGQWNNSLKELIESINKGENSSTSTTTTTVTTNEDGSTTTTTTTSNVFVWTFGPK